ncbi:MAG: signal peptidase I, partial [Anaeroplasmataceae bacterium]|nr:signal peptidase I [Anaeroplasmataceae bacterium]
GHVTYYVILGTTIGICLIVSFASIIFKCKAELTNIVTLRKAYQFYTAYDFIVFVMSTFVCLFFIIMILITPCNISGSSMENTYQDGDRVLLWNIGYQPKDGDVIVFDSAKYTSKASQETRFYIKRIVAKENDSIQYKQTTFSSGSLMVNNVYVETVSLSQYSQILNSIDVNLTYDIVTVPKDKILVLGDNRTPGGSHDSRYFGFIDESEVIGKVLFRFYPFTKIGNPNQNNR